MTNTHISPEQLHMWTANGRNMIPFPFRNHPDVVAYLANNTTDIATTLSGQGALVPIDHYQASVRQTGTNLSTIVPPQVTKPVITSGSSSIGIETIFNPKTKRYDVKVGDKVVKSFVKKSTADKFIELKGTDLLRAQAPLGNIGHPSKTPLGTAPAQPTGVPMTHENFVQKWGWDPHNLGTDVPKGGNNINLVTTPRDTHINAGMIDDSFGGYKPNATLNALNDDYRFLEQQSNYKREIGQHLKKQPEINADRIDDMLGIGKTKTTAERLGQQQMYEELWGTGGVKPNHNFKLVTDPSPVNADKIDDMLGIGKNKNVILDGMNDRYRFLEERSDLKHAIGKHLDKPTEFSPKVLDELTGHGPNKELDAMNDYYKALEGKGKINWGKVGKYAAIAAGVVALGAGIAALVKHRKNKKAAEEAAAEEAAKAEKAEPVAPPQVSTIIDEQKENGIDAVPPMVPIEETTEEVVEEITTEEVVEETTTEETGKAEEKDDIIKHLQLDENGNYVVKRGDSFWKMAEKHLKDKYAKEPEKFENLSKAKRERMIHDECTRIMHDNGYDWDENHYYPDPMLHPDVVITVKPKKVDIAA